LQIGAGAVHIYVTTPFFKGLMVQNITPVEPFQQKLSHSFYISPWIPVCVGKAFYLLETTQVSEPDAARRAATCGESEVPLVSLLRVTRIHLMEMKSHLASHSQCMRPHKIFLIVPKSFISDCRDRGFKRFVCQGR